MGKMLPLFCIPQVAVELIETARREGLDPDIASFSEVIKALLPNDQEVSFVYYETEEEREERLRPVPGMPF